MTSTDQYGEGSVREVVDGGSPVGGEGATGPAGASAVRRLTPADVAGVRFSRGTRVHPGYTDAEVDSFLDRISDELRRLTAEKGELRDQVQALRQEVSGVTRPEPPSEQAVRILAVAQQTADDYVAEAESFSRIATQEAREHYEDQLKRARDKAGAIIQAAQEAAESIVAEGAPPGDRPASQLPEEQLQEEVRYLKAFSQAVRVQLRAYLEALLTDVEAEWGRADPSATTRTAIGAPARRPGVAGPRGLADDEPNVVEMLPGQNPAEHSLPPSPARG